MEGEKKKNKEIQGSNDQSGREKEDQICSLIPNDGNQDKIIENLNQNCLKIKNQNWNYKENNWRNLVSVQV